LQKKPDLGGVDARTGTGRGLEQEEDWNRKRARELAASSQDLKLGY
jgi:hypothetical protein